MLGGVVLCGMLHSRETSARSRADAKEPTFSGLPINSTSA